jgi:hypothetical protein
LPIAFKRNLFTNSPAGNNQKEKHQKCRDQKEPNQYPKKSCKKGENLMGNCCIDEYLKN